MASSAWSPLYLGFDLSTQQLKGIAVGSDLKVVHSALFDFDKDAKGFPNIRKGVLTNEAEREVFAPVAMWLQAIDTVLQRLHDTGIDFGRVAGISGAGQQHGSVYWSMNGSKSLQTLNSTQTLQEQLGDAFSYPFSPNWQDASTQEQCDCFDKCLGDETELALNTGSKAHHRFTGPQILRFRQKHPQEYAQTSRISLVSSFLASIFLGDVAPIDISDVCGMNLWDIKKGDYNEQLLALAAGSTNTADLRSELGHVPEDGGGSFGTVAKYFVDRYGFNPDCKIIPFTGDNPSTILALPLRPMDAIVSLGTSTTFLMSTHYYKPDPAVHFFNHPTTAGLYMFMLCYKNGGLAREQIRDALPTPPNPKADPWSTFNATALSLPPLLQPQPPSPTSPVHLALYFPRPEIVPNVRAGTYRYTLTPSPSPSPSPSPNPPYTLSTTTTPTPSSDARLILESQLLSLRLRSRAIVAPPSPNPHNLPAQPRRVYLVGGGSLNPAIAQLAGEVLGGVEGVFRLDVGGNACALGSAYKAVWGCERGGVKKENGVGGEIGKIGDGKEGGVGAKGWKGETFEELVAGRWEESGFVEKVAEGYQEGRYEVYEKGVQGLEMVERDVLRRQGGDIGMAGAVP